MKEKIKQLEEKISKANLWKKLIYHL
jgi:hypothetical protein